MLQSYSQDKFVVGNNTNAFSTTPATTRPGGNYENAPGNGNNGNQRQPGSTQVNEMYYNDGDNDDDELTSLIEKTYE
jgi:hypothetical protein